MSRSRMASLWISFVLILFSINQITHSQDATPTPDTINVRSYFPDFAIECPSFETPFRGPTWNNITIGETSLKKFEQSLLGLGSYVRIPDGFYGGTSIAYQLPSQSGIGWGEEQIPITITICIEDRTITVLILDLWNANLPLTYYISQYGQPDLITWDLRATNRLAFWFERGLAVQILAGRRSHNSGWGRVGIVTYFPYQKVEDYQTRWPYNATWQQPAYDYHNEGIVTEENPFDIPATILAMTLNPTWTPTPTWTPRPTNTPTPSITSTATSTPH